MDLPSVWSEPAFTRGPEGMVRTPPNVELIAVERRDDGIWLVARRNEVALQFPLRPDDAEHLSMLLHAAAWADIPTPPSVEDAEEQGAA